MRGDVENRKHVSSPESDQSGDEQGHRCERGAARKSAHGPACPGPTAHRDWGRHGQWAGPRPRRGRAASGELGDGRGGLCLLLAGDSHHLSLGRRGVCRCSPTECSQVKRAASSPRQSPGQAATAQPPHVGT